MEQFITQLGHDGCIAAVVVSLISLVTIVITLSVLAIGLYDARKEDRRLARESDERVHRTQCRQAIYLALVEKGFSAEEALQMINQIRYD